MRRIQLVMAALSAIAVAVAVAVVAITSTARVENVWDLTGCTKGAAGDQIKCCDSGGGIFQDNGGKCVQPPPDAGPPGSQHDLSGIGTETFTPSPLRTHDPSDIGTETFTTVPVSTPQPSPPAPPSTTWVPPTNPCMNPLEPACAG